MHAPIHRCLVVWLTATAAVTALLGLLTPLALAPAAHFDEVLVRACALAGSVAAAWLWLLTTVVVVEATTGTRAWGVPASLRRLVLTACGVAILTGLVVPAQATPGEQHRDRRPVAVLTGLPLPDRAETPPPPRPSRAPADVVVRPGDTLWDLAADDLGPAADDAAIDARWREIYAHNRGVIGPDPDLIQPAQRLRLPAHHHQ
jgi:hypothetical protein